MSSVPTDNWCVIPSEGNKEEGPSNGVVNSKSIWKRSCKLRWEITNADALPGYIYTPRFAFISGQPKNLKIGFCCSGDKANFTLEGLERNASLPIHLYNVEIFGKGDVVRRCARPLSTCGKKDKVWCSFDDASKWLGDNVVIKINIIVHEEETEASNSTCDIKCEDLDFKELCEDYLKMMTDPRANLTIHVGEESFKAHKAVLRCRAPEFAQKYLNDLHSITIHDDIKPEDFRDVLVYIYTGDLSILILELRALEMYKAAHICRVPGLQRTCSDWMIENLDENIVCDVWIVADQFKDKELKIAACTYMQADLRKMKLRDDFMSLVNNRSDFLQEVERLALKP